MAEKMKTLSLKVEEAKELPLIKEGDYKAKVERIEADVPGAYGNMVQLWFKIEGADIPAIASQNLNPNTKLYSWIEIMTGKKLNVGVVFKLDELLGKEAVCTVRNRDVTQKDGTQVKTSVVKEIRASE
jgi:hypothetical protein